MKIDTPVATMGIRGTTPHVEIRDDGTVAFSTLIEDTKAIDKTLEKITAPIAAPVKKQRQTKAEEPAGQARASPASPAERPVKKAESKPETKLNGSYNINVIPKICRGC
jgi:hypothetical protein